MTYRLVVSQRAERDADAIYTWLLKHTAKGAANWFSAFRDALQAIRSEPGIYSRAPEADMLRIDLRQALFKTSRGRLYRLLFTVAHEAVHVAAVRGFGQDLATAEEIELP